MKKIFSEKIVDIQKIKELQQRIPIEDRLQFEEFQERISLDKRIN